MAALPKIVSNGAKIGFLRLSSLWPLRSGAMMALVSKVCSVLKLRSARRCALVGIFVILVVLSIFIAQGVQQVRWQADDSQCQSKLFYLGAALEIYQDYYTSLPPPFISDESGKPLYSWRVLMLPFCEGHRLYDEFDFTKPWNDPDNMSISQGRYEQQLKSLYSCPLSRRTDVTQTDYFYALNVHDRWPRDFFYDPKAPPYILLVESQARSVYWSEPIDMVYQEPGLKALLAKLRESKAIHKSGFSCFPSVGGTIKIPANSSPEFESRISNMSARMPRTEDGPAKEQTTRLVARLMDILADRERYAAFYTRHTALLLLGELGPQAKPAAAMIRQVVAVEQDVRLTRVAAFALSKIER